MGFRTYKKYLEYENDLRRKRWTGGFDFSMPKPAPQLGNMLADAMSAIFGIPVKKPNTTPPIIDLPPILCEQKKAYKQPLIPKPGDKEHVTEIANTIKRIGKFIEDNDLYFRKYKLSPTPGFEGLYQFIFIKGKDTDFPPVKQAEILASTLTKQVQDSIYIEEKVMSAIVAITKRHSYKTISEIAPMLSIMEFVIPYEKSAQSLVDWCRITGERMPFLQLEMRDPMQTIGYYLAESYSKSLKQFFGETVYKDLLSIFDADKFIDGYYNLSSLQAEDAC